MVAGVWDDPTIQAYLREWRINLERCARRVHPQCTIDRFGRLTGQVSGGFITAGRDPDPIPDTVIPSSREYYYIWFHNPTGTQFYPLSGSQYAEQRIAGVSPGSLTACSP